MLGGGAFGNPTEWITDAFMHSKLLSMYTDVVVVSYGRSQPDVQRLIHQWQATNEP